MSYKCMNMNAVSTEQGCQQRSIRACVHMCRGEKVPEFEVKLNSL